MAKFSLRPRPSKHTRPSNSALLFVCLVGVVGILIFWRLFLFEKKSSIPATTPTDNAAVERDKPLVSEKTSGSISEKSSEQSNDTSVSSPVVELKTPSGSFVSNHRPSLSGSSAPSTEQSVCNTTPGASCEITFKKGGETKSLMPQPADSEGNVYWSWDVQQAGFSAGAWKVTAIAKLGDKIQTTVDQLEFEVQP